MSVQRSADDQPKVGILAPTANLATSLAQELGISRPVALSPRSLNRVRGIQLSSLIVEDSLWPLDSATAASVLPCLARSRGYMFHARRIDPTRKRAS